MTCWKSAQAPGITTDILRERCRHLTCIEIDHELAASLHARLEGANVFGTRRRCHPKCPSPTTTFSGAACFTMLHHVPSAELQDRLLSEAHRVLRKGGWIAGVDSRISFRFRLLHIADTMVVCDPQTFKSRLERAGFENVSIGLADRAFSFPRPQALKRIPHSDRNATIGSILDARRAGT